MAWGLEPLLQIARHAKELPGRRTTEFQQEQNFLAHQYPWPIHRDQRLAGYFSDHSIRQ